MELDMTKGKPFRLILKFIIPVMFGNMLQQLYNTVDSIIVGRFVGVGALAAVGSTGNIIFLINGFLIGLTAGFTVLTAQRYGAKDEKGLKRSIGNGACLAVIMTVIITIISMAFMRPLLKVMNTPEDIFSDAYVYIMIFCGGLFCTALYNMMASIMRAVGNSTVPLIFLIVAVIVNCVLDLALILIFHMGVAGAALATVISQGLSGVLCLLYVWKKVPLVCPGKGNWYLDAHDSKLQLAVGVPMALQFSITAIGTIILQGALNMLGSIAVAAYTATVKIEQIFTQPFLAMGVTMASYSAQNMGIKNVKRIREGVRTGSIITIIYSILLGLFAVVIVPYAIKLFVTTQEIVQVTEFAQIYIHISALFYVPLGLIFVYRNALQGTGKGFLPMFGGVVELVSRTLLAVLAAYQHSFEGVCYANISAWVTAAVFLFISYLVVMKNMEQTIPFAEVKEQ